MAVMAVMAVMTGTGPPRSQVIFCENETHDAHATGGALSPYKELKRAGGIDLGTGIAIDR